MKTIYLDNAASMPMYKEAIKEVATVSSKYYANPFSTHAKGTETRNVLMNAKKELANELSVKPEELVLTSGGTESNALAILGIARVKRKEDKNKIIISAIEHSSIYENAKKLEKEGFIVKEIPMNENSGLDFAFLEREIDTKTAIVSVVSVNSDTGIINDISKIAKMCKNRGVLLHVDHLQGFCKIKLQPKSIGVDLVSADAHKIGGPKGIGLLYVREGTKIDSLFSGSEKESVLRSGTENVPGAAGFAVALKEYRKINWDKVEKSRDELEMEIEKIGGRITGKNIPRVSSHLHVCFKKISGIEMVNYLSTKGIYCATGSACDSNKKERRIIQNLGVPEEYINGPVRFSLAEPISASDIKKVSQAVNTFLMLKSNRNV